MSNQPIGNGHVNEGTDRLNEGVNISFLVGNQQHAVSADKEKISDVGNAQYQNNLKGKPAVDLRTGYPRINCRQQ